MPVEVDFHPQAFAEFFAPVDLQFPGLSAVLRAEFLRYMVSARLDLPSIFGRDAPYTQPALALQVGLMHIHIKIPPAKFPSHVPQGDRVCRRGRPNEDVALVYTSGELYEDRHILLAVLWPHAHAKAREEALMRHLSRLAKDWKEQN